MHELLDGASTTGPVKVAPGVLSETVSITYFYISPLDVSKT